ncbi:MAG: tetratricopeptide repeat protein [Bernardetiaceae bacterium]|jgi:tetratricopeptide (TPR) repeat protein|nr:tetratricopeptide repeat protein [Bernardetiaceae bacterium]
MAQKNNPPDAKDETVRRYEQMLKDDQVWFFDVEAFERIIYYYLNQDQLSKALQACGLALDQYPFSTELQVAKAKALAQGGRWQAALALADEAELTAPTDEELLMLKAYLYAALENYPQSIVYLKKVLPFSSEKDEVHCRLAETYLRLDQPQRAAEHYAEALHQNPDQMPALLALVDVLEDLGETRRGRQVLENYAQANPESHLVWRNLGVYNNETGRFEEAVQLLNRAVTLKDNHVSTWLNLGHAHLNLRDAAKAHDCYQQARRLQNPVEPETLCCLAASQEKLGRFEEAMKNYRAALAIDEHYDDAYYGIGCCLNAQEKWYEAIHFFRRAVNLNPEEEEYWLGLAEAEYETGNVVSATEAYERASELGPDNPDTWLDWSYILYEQGDYDKAIDLVKTGIDEVPHHAELHYRLCAYHIAAGKYSQGVAYLENALILDFDSHTVLLEFFDSLEVQKALYKIINQYRNR